MIMRALLLFAAAILSLQGCTIAPSRDLLLTDPLRARLALRETRAFRDLACLAPPVPDDASFTAAPVEPPLPEPDLTDVPDVVPLDPLP